MKTDIIRDRFLDFFKSKKHKLVESDSLVPAGDPTVLFTPAGMNQFKKEFLGYDSGFSRAATSQRCLRTDDLDKVGKTTGHHTFFEMLGNFSFGDYFKEEAIAWAWEFLTKELKIKEDKLWASVYKDDEEAYRIWKDKIKLPAKKIVRLGDKENFWPSEAKTKGPNGPCGPCSEIFYDLGKDIGCGESACDPSCSCGRFIEIWNLVFTQFNRKEGGLLEPLPNKNIDTGMGLERLAAVMQGAKNNFETDLFQPLIEEIARNTPRSPNLKSPDIYAIVDHIRAIVFAIYDGVLPSNEERGYVVRKLIRKSTLHLMALGMKQPFLYKLVPVLSEIMRKPYPELALRQENIAEIILAEEKNFYSTISLSPDLFKEKFSGFLKKQDSRKAGKVAFMLYDTYGIPLELTKDWLDKNKIDFSLEDFNQELKQQKDRSKLNSAMKGDVFDVNQLHLPNTKTSFSGYLNYEAKAKILKIIKDNTPAKKINKGEEAKIILDKTVFYPESGGQVGDTGQLIKGRNIFQVTDTQKFDKVIVHKGKVLEGSFKDKDELKASVDIERRLAIARNHTATHLLQAALRKVLGGHVKQQGSLVAADRLRFDFTHFKDVNEEELDRIEEIVNGYILNNCELNVVQMSLPEAKKKGALAFFGEKYESKVRMVSIGNFSKELCGGTHLEATGSIGLFKITQESSVASGVRRIEAVTGLSAYKMVKEEEGILKDASLILNVNKEKLAQELAMRLSRLKALEKQANVQKMENLKVSLDELIGKAETIKDVKVIVSVMENLDMDLLRKNVDLIKQKTTNTVIALGSKNRGRALLVIGITQDLNQKGLDASKLILNLGQVIGGSGGGRKDFAQAGGSKPENFEQAFNELKNIIRDSI
ncbi:MAG: alanine--tRNA ligase [Candidatus Omnitrophica bacterium]|nr:alanine--tRNA ligase [Candidatus Omnitrophota bacterium]